jgi:hypothetical protein
VLSRTKRGGLAAIAALIMLLGLAGIASATPAAKTPVPTTTTQNVQHSNHIIPPSTGVDLICPSPDHPEQGIQLQVNTQKFPDAPSTLTVTASAKGLSDISIIVENISATNPSGLLKNSIPAEYGLGDGFSVHITWTADGGGQTIAGPFTCIINPPPVPTPTTNQPTPQPNTPVVYMPPKKHAKPFSPTLVITKQMPSHIGYMQDFYSIVTVGNPNTKPIRVKVRDILPKLLIGLKGQRVFGRTISLKPGGTHSFKFGMRPTAAALHQWVRNCAKAQIVGFKKIYTACAWTKEPPGQLNLQPKFRVH